MSNFNNQNCFRLKTYFMLIFFSPKREYLVNILIMHERHFHGLLHHHPEYPAPHHASKQLPRWVFVGEGHCYYLRGNHVQHVGTLPLCGNSCNSQSIVGMICQSMLFPLCRNVPNHSSCGNASGISPSYKGW